jgi:uncharacterized membrane protein YwaF
MTIKHIQGLAICLLLIIVILRILLKGKRNVNRVILSFIITFYVLEILKNIFLYQWYGHYNLSNLPFYLCSAPLYILWGLIVFKEGTNKKILKGIIYGVFLGSSIVPMLIPKFIIGSKDFWDFSMDNLIPMISYLFHSLMLLIPLYMILSKYYKPKYFDLIYMNIYLVVWSSIVYVVNHLLQTNFMFLNDPVKSPIAFLQQYDGFLLFILSLGAYIIVLTTISFFITSLYLFVIRIKRDKENNL